MCIIKKEIEESNLTCSGLEGKEECEKCPCRKEVTEREAINFLRLEGIEVKGNPRRLAEFFDGLDVAITALEEIQEYRAIGTVEECRRAMKNKMELPCAVGDKLFVINKNRNNLITEENVYDVQYRGEKYAKGQRFFMNIGALAYFEMDFGKTVFLTREEAEAALKELEGKEE